jgi:thiol-disulfide isomerase/thioredoxin
MKHIKINKIMKSKCIVTLIMVLTFSQIKAQKETFDFTLDCHFKNDFSGYIYFNYEGNSDSCLVVNNRFTFNGKTTNRIVFGELNLGSNPVSGGGLYIDSDHIELELTTDEIKESDGFKYMLFSIESIKGSETTKMQKDYETFFEKHFMDANFKENLYKEITAIVAKNPQNPLGGDIISEISGDNEFDKNVLKSLYAKLDKKGQTEMTIKVIEKNLFPEKYISVNGYVFDFTLPDKNNKPFKTSSLKGKWFLIDFWASWCAPCRQQFPELKRIYEANNKNFEIVSVSIDKRKEDWFKALEKEKLNWINLIEDKGFDGELVKKYNILGVPSNFLINQEGKVIAVDISMQDLEKIIKKL